MEAGRSRNLATGWEAGEVEGPVRAKIRRGSNGEGVFGGLCLDAAWGDQGRLSSLTFVTFEPHISWCVKGREGRRGPVVRGCSQEQGL